MISTSIKSIAADSNVLLSAVAGKAARRVFSISTLMVVTTESNRAEVIEYLPYFAERYGLDAELVAETFALLPVKIYGPREYNSHLAKAQRFIAARDKDDVALAALALKLEIPIWSNDKDYEHFPHGTFTTAQLIKFLSV